ncbi:MAG: ribonuclease III domain-containing protein [Clostridiales bacterium]|nr:ribonuclease III domain-containing protein [Clostridiales bacterium]
MEKDFVTAFHLESFLDKLKVYAFEHSMVTESLLQGDNENRASGGVKDSKGNESIGARYLDTKSLGTEASGSGSLGTEASGFGDSDSGSLDTGASDKGSFDHGSHDDESCDCGFLDDESLDAESLTCDHKDLESSIIPKYPLKSAGTVINVQAENRLFCSRPELLSPLVLAYIGDAVYEIYIRTKVFCNGNFPVGSLHRSSTGFVRAKSQAEAVRKMMDNLSQDEKDIVRRGRNSKPGYVRKNADMIDYKYATGFEALIGYLYLKGENDRLFYVLEMSFSNYRNL